MISQENYDNAVREIEDAISRIEVGKLRTMVSVVLSSVFYFLFMQDYLINEVNTDRLFAPSAYMAVYT